MTGEKSWVTPTDRALWAAEDPQTPPETLIHLLNHDNPLSPKSPRKFM